MPPVQSAFNVTADGVRTNFASSMPSQESLVTSATGNASPGKYGVLTLTERSNDVTLDESARQ
jgi:hypothetical protein